MIPLDHQEFCRYCQYNCHEQKSNYLHHIYAGAQLKIFQGRGGFIKSGHFDKDFQKKFKEKSPTGENFGVFS